MALMLALHVLASSQERCLEIRGLSARFRIPAGLEFKSGASDRMFAANYDRPGHILEINDLALSIVAGTANSSSLGSWLLQKVKVAQGSVEIKQMRFPNESGGLLVKGRWPDAGNGRAIVYFIFNDTNKNWRISAEAAWRPQATEALVKMVLDVASSAVFSVGPCPAGARHLK